MINLDHLNEVQTKAVRDTEGAVLVFAGAGSGKTRVLTYRIAHLIEDKNVPAYRILAITFTNKATNEMKMRLEDMLGANEVCVSTFHSFCVKILFRHAELLGYSPNFTIYDEVASKKVVAKVLREKHIEDEKDKQRDKYRYHISTAKNAGMSPDEYFYSIKAENKDALLISEVYEAYEATLKFNNAMDFDDLLIKCRQLFIEQKQVLERYQQRFMYIHVDEFQDTNEVQFELVKLLAGGHGNVFVVGDDDQSIYGWRGANVKNILSFDKVFPDAKTYKLEQNYRSTQEILDSANRLIKHNTARSEKALFTAKTGGARVEYVICNSDYNEVDRVIETITALKRYPHGYVNSDIAILVRNNALTRLFEINLGRIGIKYKVYGGFKFFDRKEILDVIAYLRIIVNPRDSEAILRVINVPKRGIGDTTAEQLMQYANDHNITLYDAIVNIDNIAGFNAGVKRKVAEFGSLIERLSYESINSSFNEFVDRMISIIGFEQYYLSTKKEEDEIRWENITEFKRHVKENYGSSEGDIADFLQTIALNNQDEENEFDNESVTIATMHAVKGLEFKVVIIVGCDDGIIPSKRNFSPIELLEEERRVMYVAMTRAQERLYVFCVKGYRQRFGYNEAAMPSRFISEAKGEPVSIHREPKSSYLENYKVNSYDAGIPKNADMGAVKFVGSNMNDSGTKVYNKSTAGFVAGAKVHHPKYGRGTVIIVSGIGSGTTVSVVFPSLGVKKFSLMSAPLTLEGKME